LESLQRPGAKPGLMLLPQNPYMLERADLLLALTTPLFLLLSNVAVKNIKKALTVFC